MFLCTQNMNRITISIHIFLCFHFGTRRQNRVQSTRHQTRDKACGKVCVISIDIICNSHFIFGHNEKPSIFFVFFRVLAVLIVWIFSHFVSLFLHSPMSFASVRFMVLPLSIHLSVDCEKILPQPLHQSILRLFHFALPMGRSFTFAAMIFWLVASECVAPLVASRCILSDTVSA